MREDALRSALSVRGTIRPLEEKGQDYLADLGTLLASVIEARRTVGVPSHEGQEVLSGIAEAISLTTRSFGSVVAVHAQLTGYYRDYMPKVALGDHGCQPVKGVDAFGNVVGLSRTANGLA